MTQCYLVVVSRNKWTDYGLITEIPATLGTNGVALRKTIKSHFPLDYVDSDIKSTEKIIEPGIHLQLWCGRIESFSIAGIPYVEQIGRPINLGVGVLQELSGEREYLSYKLIDLRSILSPLICNYQREQGYKPSLLELHGLGVNSTIALCKNTEQASIRREEAQNNTIVRSSVDQVSAIKPASVSLNDAGESNASTGYSSWTDDLIWLSRFSLEVLDLLGSHTRYHSSKRIHHFLSCASRRVGSLSAANPEMNWRIAFKGLMDIWDVPIEKKLFAAIKLENPFWRHPNQGIRDAAKTDILNQQLRILTESLEIELSLESIEFRFAQISDAFHAALLDMLD